MNLTKKEKERAAKGAIIGGIAGACLGVPVLGAMAGAFVNTKEKTESNGRKRKKV